MYHPQLGRFASRDPITYTGGSNLLAYVANKPIRLVDPSGNDWVLPWNPDAQWWFGLKNPFAASQRPPEFGAVSKATSLSVQEWRVDCTDRLGCTHIMGFRKTCVGASVGVNAGGGIVRLGGGCDPSSYEGYFLEIGGGHIIGGNLDIGFGERRVFGYPLPVITDPTGTWEVGGGVTWGWPVNASWCYYTCVYHFLSCPGCPRRRIPC